jgi:predicted phosphodiesterase
MKDTIVVGDLHGDIHLYQQIKSKFATEKIILLGDLVDSFTFTRSEQFRLVEEVLSDIGNCEERRIQCVKGNHEWSYLRPERMKCSGYSSSFAAQLMPLFSKMFSLMPHYILDEEKKVLITHAGLSKRLFLQGMTKGIMDDTPITIAEVKEFLETEVRKIDYGLVYDIGISRGGVGRVGGIFWCDWYVDFTPIEGLMQIFGHTPTSEIRVKGANWMIDCLPKKPSVVKWKEDNTIEIINL